MKFSSILKSALISTALLSATLQAKPVYIATTIRTRCGTNDLNGKCQTARQELTFRNKSPFPVLTFGYNF